MERGGQSRQRWWAALVFAALAGCTHTTADGKPGSAPVAGPSVQTAMKAVGLDSPPPAPATQLFCFWQRELSQLPDPSREGQMAPGIAGQLYLLDSQSRPADVAGDVTVAVHDATPRPAGGAAKTPEVWHFTRETVERMKATDERFGRSHVLFLPWPPAWTDVTTVRVLTRYDPAGGPTLHASEVKLTIDRTATGGWQKVDGPAPATLIVPAGAKVLEQVGR